MDSFVNLSIEEYNRLFIQAYEIKEENVKLSNEADEQRIKAEDYEAKFRFQSFIISLLLAKELPVPKKEIVDYALAIVIDNGARGEKTEFTTSSGDKGVVEPEDVNYLLNISRNSPVQVRNIIDRLRSKYPKVITLSDDYKISDFTPPYYHFFGCEIHA
ncbi:MAG: hypothetical protein J6O73_11300 [Lachnospiraceae bacterium]|nr:hypothetical protein [Lachnospiraceae bacterium]